MLLLSVDGVDDEDTTTAEEPAGIEVASEAASTCMEDDDVDVVIRGGDAGAELLLLAESNNTRSDSAESVSENLTTEKNKTTWEKSHTDFPAQRHQIRHGKCILLPLLFH